MRTRLTDYLASHDITLSLPGYADLYVLMTVLCVLLALEWGAVRGFSRMRFFFATCLTVLIGLAGARVYGLLLQRVAFGVASFLPDVLWRGETGSFGGHLGGLAGAVIAARVLKRDALEVLDVYAPCIALSIGIGRTGCFLAGCCYGETSSLPWAVGFPRGSAVYLQHQIAGLLSPHAVLSLPVHPTQVYEALFGFALAAFLFRAGRIPGEHGRLLSALLIAYGSFRFLIECIRADRLIVLGPLSLGQLLALVMLVIGVTIGFTLLHQRSDRTGTCSRAQSDQQEVQEVGRRTSVSL